MHQKNEKNSIIPLQTIPYSSLKMGKLLGHGGYGDVYKATWQGTEVAVKKLHLKVLSKTAQEEFIHESQLMAQTQFPRIVGLYGVCDEAGHKALVMEYMAKGSLRSVLENLDEALPWGRRWSIAMDIGNGLNYLHQKNILHRDLKSHNILLDANYRAKIGDFGLAKVKLESSSSTKSNKAVGTARWMAPELLDMDNPSSPNKASDVYSYGMVLWEISTREIPFKNAPNEMVATLWIANKKKETIPSDCPPAYGEVIKETWLDPACRSSAEEVVSRLDKTKPEPVVEQPKAAIKSYVEKCWHFDPTTERKAALENNPNADYLLLEATPKDFQKAVTFYQHYPVPEHEIGSVQVIYNRGFNTKFEIYLKEQQHKKNNPAFVAKWSSMSNVPLRQKTIDHMNAMTQPFVDPDYPDVKLMPTWHGTNPNRLDSLFKIGYSNLAFTDAGFFGKGLYSAYEAEYSWRVYSKGALVFNWNAIFSALPVIDGDMSLLSGQGNYGTYDAYFVPVVPLNPNNPNEVNYYPCKTGQKHQYTELVVFQNAACLPRYLVHLRKTTFSKPIADQQLSSFLDSSSTIVKKEGNKQDVTTFKSVAPTNPLPQVQEQLVGTKVPKEPLFTTSAPQSFFSQPKKEIFSPSTSISNDEGKKDYEIGNQFYNLCQYQKAFPYMEQAASKGYPAAYLRLACFYQDGNEGVSKDKAKSDFWTEKVSANIEWFKQQAEEKSADALKNLGDCYYDVGVSQDYRLAVKYYQLAADQGYALAQYNLGICYEVGLGVSKDDKLAVKYYQLAADQGLALAQSNLGVCYRNGRGVLKDDKLALKYLQLAADQGYAVAQSTLGACYRNGRGVLKDDKLALKYFQLAADQEYANAQCQLGYCYLQNKGIPKDEKLGVKYYQLAADQGFAIAQYELGVCYEYGKGVTKDEKIATYYYQLAANQGDEYAKTALKSYKFNKYYLESSKNSFQFFNSLPSHVKGTQSYETYSKITHNF